MKFWFCSPLGIWGRYFLPLSKKALKYWKQLLALAPVVRAAHEGQSCTQMNRAVWKLSCRCRTRVLGLGWAKLGCFRVEQTLLLPSLTLFSYLFHFLDCAAVFGRTGSSWGVGESKCRWLWRTWLVLKDWLGYSGLRTFYFSYELHNSIEGIHPMCSASKSRTPANTGAWCLKNMRKKTMAHVEGERERTRSVNNGINVSFLGKKNKTTPQ